MVWLALLIASTDVDRDSESWLWNAHRWEPHAETCVQAAVSVTAALLDVETGPVTEFDEVEPAFRAAGAAVKDARRKPAEMSRTLRHQGGVFLIEGEDGELFVVAGNDPTRPDPWLTSNCHRPSPRWVTLKELTEARATSRRALWVGEPAPFPLTDALDLAEDAGLRIEALEPTTQAMWRTVRAHGRSAWFVIPGEPVVGRETWLIATPAPGRAWHAYDMARAEERVLDGAAVDRHLVHGGVAYALIAD
ncbi:MAG: hypothetical protein GY913_03440 [Proteobacteria bacterium]|nr:hypothetical protein [Pseudomonadota bacterium]MCP4915954.1 hypothetical protein [Pseudomonadota bacterium]